MKKLMAVMLVAAMGIGLVGTAQPALADHHRDGHGAAWLAAGLVLLDAVLAPRTTVVYQQPAVVYAPPPVVYAPPPVVYRPVFVPPPLIHRPPVFHIQPFPPRHDIRPWFRTDFGPPQWRGGHSR